MTEFIEAIPSQDQFRRDLLPIFPDGDLDVAYNLLVAILGENKTSTNTHEPVTWPFILKSFEEHHNQWRYLYGKQADAGYLSNKNLEKRKNIQEFLEKESWNRDYPIQKGTIARNDYLFGKLPIENLMKQLSDFKDGYKEK